MLQKLREPGNDDRFRHVRNANIMGKRRLYPLILACQSDCYNPPLAGAHDNDAFVKVLDGIGHCVLPILHKLLKAENFLHARTFPMTDRMNADKIILMLSQGTQKLRIK